MRVFLRAQTITEYEQRRLIYLGSFDQRYGGVVVDSGAALILASVSVLIMPRPIGSCLPPRPIVPSHRQSRYRLNYYYLGSTYC